ncbi:Metallo-dependent phosphatase-like protein [Hyaloraphidium curvatum]|nr:Metallo-dependent phosphatase-like protein [Hyaloraphidium curvatum]
MALLFAQLGDPQLGLGADGLARDRERFAWALRDARERGCAFAVAVGDLTNDAKPEQVEAYRAVAEEALGVDAEGRLGMDVYNVAGNHDMQSSMGLANFISSYLAPPFPPFPESHFCFSPPGTDSLFLVLNTVVLTSSVPDLQDARRKHWEWLRTTLPAAKGKTVVVCGHHPLFCLDEGESDTNEAPVSDKLRGFIRGFAGFQGEEDAVDRAAMDMQMITVPTKERSELIELFKAAGVKHYLFGHTHTRFEVPASDGSFVQYSASGTSMSLDFPQHRLNYRLWTGHPPSIPGDPWRLESELVYLPEDMCPPTIPNEQIEKMGARPVPSDGRKVKPGREFLTRIEERRREILGS